MCLSARALVKNVVGMVCSVEVEFHAFVYRIGTGK